MTKLRTLLAGMLLLSLAVPAHAQTEHLFRRRLVPFETYGQAATGELRAIPSLQTGMNVLLPANSGSLFSFSVRNVGTAETGTLSREQFNSTNFHVESDTCNGKTLKPNRGCIVSVRPYATSVGDYLGNLVYSATPGGMAIIDMAGIGVGAGAASLRISPAYRDDMDIQNGYSVSSPATFVVSNVGGESTSVLVVAISSGSDNFAIYQDSCSGHALASGGQCMVMVYAKSTSAEIMNGELSAFAALGGVATASLSGISYAGPSDLAIFPETQDGMNVTGPATTGSIYTFTVTNTGSETTSALALELSNLDNFALATEEEDYDTCTGQTLLPGSNCQVKLYPMATQGAFLSGRLMAFANVGGVARATLSGLATKLGAPALVIQPNPKLDMDVAGPAEADGYAYGEVAIFNIYQVGADLGGANSIYDTQLTLSVDDPEHFDILPNEPAGSPNLCYPMSDPAYGGKFMMAGSFCQVGVRPKAQVNGGFSGQLVARVPGIFIKETAILAGTATALAPDEMDRTSLALTPDVQSGMDVVGPDDMLGSWMPFTLANEGLYPAVNVQATLTNNLQFEINPDTNTCAGITLDPAGTCTLEVRTKSAVNATMSGQLVAMADNADPALAELSGTSTNFGARICPALAITPASATLDIISGYTQGGPVVFWVENTSADTVGCTLDTMLDNTDNFLFGGNLCEGVALLPGGKCSIEVLSQDNGTGTSFTGTLTVRNREDAAFVSAPLAGAPAPDALLTITPAIQAGMDATGTDGISDYYEFVVTCYGGASYIYLEPVLTNPANFEFDSSYMGHGECVDGSNYVSSFPATCRLRVRAKSREAGSYAGQLVVNAAIIGQSASSALSGSAHDFLPKLVIVPDNRLDMWITPPATDSAPVTFQVTNQGLVSSGEIMLALTDEDHFIIVSDGCSGVDLAPGGYCPVEVVAHSEGGSTVSGDLVAIGSAGGDGATATMQGGVSGGGAQIMIVPTAHKDMDVLAPATESAPARFDVTNMGTATSTPLRMFLEYDEEWGESAFEITSDACTGNTLPAGQSCAVEVVRHISSHSGYDFDYLTVEGWGKAEVGGIQMGVGTSADLRMTGDEAFVLAPPYSNYVAGSPDSFDRKYSAEHTITVTNVGGGASGVMSDAHFDYDNGFEIVSDGCSGQTLASMASCGIVVRTFAETSFVAPGWPGATDYLNVEDALGNYGYMQMNRQVTGAGDASFVVSPYEYRDFTVVCGSEVGETYYSDLKSFEITNIGGTAGDPAPFLNVGYGTGTYEIVNNDCPALLAPGASCIVDVVASSILEEVETSGGGSGGYEE